MGKVSPPHQTTAGHFPFSECDSTCARSYSFDFLRNSFSRRNIAGKSHGLKTLRRNSAMCEKTRSFEDVGGYPRAFRRLCFAYASWRSTETTEFPKVSAAFPKPSCGGSQ